MYSSSEIHEIEKEIEEPYKIDRVLRYNKFLGYNKESKEYVSFTLITNLFDSYYETATFLQDLQACSKLNHENIIRLINLKTTQYSNHKKSLIITLETLDTYLDQIIHSDQTLTEDHRRYFLYQILRGLKYLHSANIIHKNLKPSNIAINANCDIKIKTIDEEILDGHICCRWYKPPETILLYEDQSYSIDVWSVGCILYELIMRKPLFPCRSTLDLLKKIVETIGSPKEDDLFYLTNKKAIKFMNSLPKVIEVNWNELIPNGTDNEIDLIKSMLTWNPTKRISVEEALKHSYFDDLHDPSDEPCSSPIEVFDIKQINKGFDFQNYFWNEIQRIRKDNNFE